MHAQTYTHPPTNAHTHTPDKKQCTLALAGSHLWHIATCHICRIYKLCMYIRGAPYGLYIGSRCDLREVTGCAVMFPTLGFQGQGVRRLPEEHTLEAIILLHNQGTPAIGATFHFLQSNDCMTIHPYCTSHIRWTSLLRAEAIPHVCVNICLSTITYTGGFP